MKRPIFTGALFVVTGAVGALCSSFLLTLMAGLIELAVMHSFCRKMKLQFYYDLYLIFLFLILIYVFNQTSEKKRVTVLEQDLSEAGKVDCSVTGKVSMVVQKDGYVQIQMRNCHIMIQTDNETIKQNTNISKAGVLVYVKEYSGFMGDEIYVEGELKAFDQPRNEGEFDTRTYYHSIGMDYLCQADDITIRHRFKQGIYGLLDQFQKKISTVYQKIVNEKEAGILGSVILGDKTNLDQNIKKLYQTSGIAHLLAISGLHVSIIGMTIYRGVRRLLPFLPAAMISGCIMLGYLYMTGNGISTIRAVVMFFIAMGAEVLGRTYDFKTALSMAAILLILEDGRVITNSGFQLSFFALIGVGFVFPILSETFNIFKKKTQKKLMADALLISISVQLSTLPIILLQYFQFPVYGFLLNIVVIPLMSLVMISGIMGGLAGLVSIKLASAFIGPAHYILLLYEQICRLYEKLPGAVCVMGKPETSAIAIYAVLLSGGLLLLSHKGKIQKFPICNHSVIQSSVFLRGMIIGVIIISVLQLKPVQSAELVVNMIDVGQGDSIYVRNRDGITCLFDGGSSDVKNVGERRILPYLKSQGVSSLDYIMISHADTDHINGVIELINLQDCAFRIHQIVLPDIQGKQKDERFIEIVQAAERAGILVSYASTGNQLTDENNLEITCVHPEKDYMYESRNDYSAVYLLRYQNFKLLLTGDAEERAELKMLSEKERTALCDVNVLKAGHHGSLSSSSKEFLSFIKPEAALISCGVNNSYGHPHKQVIDNLEEERCKSFVTSILGAIRIESDGKSYTVTSFLQADKDKG